MNFNNTQEKEFEIDLKLYKKLVCEKGYKLPTPPIAMIKATAALDQKDDLKITF